MQLLTHFLHGLIRQRRLRGIAGVDEQFLVGDRLPWVILKNQDCRRVGAAVRGDCHGRAKLLHEAPAVSGGAPPR